MLQLLEAIDSRFGNPTYFGFASGDRIAPAFPQELRNSYMVWRHGESEANAAGMIISNLQNGRESYGLTAAGRIQVRKATLSASGQGLIDVNSLLYCSPLLRCIDTASEIANEVSIREIIVRDELRERNFGKFEGHPKQNYQTVYELDKFDPTHKTFEVESVLEVSSRVTGLVRFLEQVHCGRRIILVTHADVGEILQTAFLGLLPNSHRNLPKLRNAEPRELRLMCA